MHINALPDYSAHLELYPNLCLCYMHMCSMFVLNIYTGYLLGQLLWWCTIGTLFAKLSFVAMTSAKYPRLSCIDADALL